jgi:hypothetical protein
MCCEFLAAWLQRDLPPPGRLANVAELAARLRADAANAGIELGPCDGPALEQTILAAVGARLEVQWGCPSPRIQPARAA